MFNVIYAQKLNNVTISQVENSINYDDKSFINSCFVKV